MQGVYEILNFLTGDDLYTHQIPRAMRECRPWLASQFPQLMDDAPGMPDRLADMDRRIETVSQDRASIAKVIEQWVETLRVTMGLPEMLRVYELGADIHTRIDPIDEARTMIGEGNVVVVVTEKGK